MVDVCAAKRGKPLIHVVNAILDELIVRLEASDPASPEEARAIAESLTV